MTLSIHAVHNRDALLSELRSIDPGVARRTKGRTKQQTETRIICRLLSTLARNNSLEFPISAFHRDRPDVCVQVGSTSIGVEVTEAIPQQFAAFAALAETRYPNSLLDFGLFRWDSPKLTRRDMHDLLPQGQITSDGWEGDQPERDWALFIHRVVITKLQKLAAQDFEKSDRNWLSIYDNLPLPDIDLSDATGYLRPLLESNWSRQPTFDAIFVEHGICIVKVTELDTTCLALNDIW
jgi:hypothetical protein